MMESKKGLFIFLGMIVLIIGYIYFRPVWKNALITKEYKKSSAYINDLYKSDEYFKNKILSEEGKNIYEKIKKASLENQVEVSIPCVNNCVEEFYLSVNALYLDHPELISFTGVRKYTYYNNTLQYDNLINFSKLKAKLGARRIERIIDKIKRKTQDMSDKEKIIYVYNYVASHDYDKIFKTNKSNQSAYSFFSKGESVCAGFAKTSQLIFQNIGINSYLALSDNHMWNYVEYNKKWYIFDATFGASFQNKEHELHYEGLGTTTTGVRECLYYELYPTIEEENLKDLFGLK